MKFMNITMYTSLLKVNSNHSAHVIYNMYCLWSKRVVNIPKENTKTTAAMCKPKSRLKADFLIK